MTNVRIFETPDGYWRGAWIIPIRNNSELWTGKMASREDVVSLFNALFPDGYKDTNHV